MHIVSHLRAATIPLFRFYTFMVLIIYRLIVHKGQLPTCHMIASKVVDYINVLNPLTLLAVLAQLLSHLIITRPPNKKSDESKAISPSAFRKDIPSLAAAPHTWYSASIVDAAAVACLLLDHDTAPPYMVTTHPVVLRQVSVHVAMLASHQNHGGCLFSP
jgi:hypothetical protein